MAEDFDRAFVLMTVLCVVFGCAFFGLVLIAMFGDQFANIFWRG